MKRLIPLLLVFAFSSATAQIPYFNHRYGRQIDTDIINNIVKTDSGYHILSHSNDLYFPYSSSLNYYYINNEGQTIVEKQYYRDTITYDPSFLKIHKGKLIVVTSIGSNNPDIGHYSEMLTFNSNFELTGDKRYVAEDSIYSYEPSDFIRLYDGRFLIVGYRINTTNDNWDAYYMFTDSLGNMISRTNFEGIYGNAFRNGVQDSTSKHIYISGYTRVSSSTSRDAWVIKMDTLGNIIWDKKYGTSETDWGTSIIQTTDGNFVISLISSSPQQGYLFKIDSSGNQIWQSDFIENDPYYSNTQFYTVAENTDGSLVATGIAGKTGIQHDAGVLVKFSSTGEFLWKQLYDFFTTGSEYLNDVVPTSDGGYLMAGAAMDTALPSQQAWVLKVDSLGCPYPNCTVGIDEESKTVAFNLWPNPATDALHIQTTDINITHLNIFDQHGQILLSTELPNIKLPINISSLSPGIYIAKISNNERNWHKMIIKN